MMAEWVTVVISIIALAVSIGSAVFSIRSNTNLKTKRLQFEALMTRKASLEGARASIIGAASEIDGVMTMLRAAYDLRPEEGYNDKERERYNDSLLTAMKNFVRVRESYETFSHHLNSASRSDLDRRFEEVKVSYDDVVTRERDDPAAIVLTAEELAGLLMWPKQVLETVSKNIEAIESLIKTDHLLTSTPVPQSTPKAGQ